MEKTTYQFKSLYFNKVLICDNCEKKIFPRQDVAFKDFKYGVVFCLDCKTNYDKKNFKK